MPNIGIHKVSPDCAKRLKTAALDEAPKGNIIGLVTGEWDKEPVPDPLADITMVTCDQASTIAHRTLRCIQYWLHDNIIPYVQAGPKCKIMIPLEPLMARVRRDKHPWHVWYEMLKKRKKKDGITAYMLFAEKHLT